MMAEILKSVGDPGTGDDHTPQLDSNPWELKLLGATTRALDPPLSLEDLLNLESEPFEQDQGVKCVSAGQMTLGRPSVRFAGVRFTTLAQYMGFDPDPERWREEWPTVIFRSKAKSYGGPKTEPHTTSLPLRDCLDPQYQVMLATHLDGEPLPYTPHGGPLRLVVGPELYFYKAIKWLAEVEIVDGCLDDHLGTWEKYSGYHKRGRVRFTERFTPMLRRIVGVQRTDQGVLVDETLALATEVYDATLKEAIEQRKFSRLIGARMHEIDRVAWHAIPDKDLSNFTFSDGDFHAKLRGTSFAGFSFVGCDLARCNFSLSIFSGAKFSRPDGSNPADLSQCDLEGANFKDAHLRDVSMEGATLTNVTFYDPAKFDQPTDRVEGLNVRNAIQLDPQTKAWLKKNGADV